MNGSLSIIKYTFVYMPEKENALFSPKSFVIRDFH